MWSSHLCGVGFINHARERGAATERHITKPLKRLGFSLGEETYPKHRESEAPARRCDDVPWRIPGNKLQIKAQLSKILLRTAQATSRNRWAHRRGKELNAGVKPSVDGLPALALAILLCGVKFAH
jgi:hypothetical protein